MKQIFYICILIVMVFLGILGVTTFWSRQAVKRNLENSVDIALEQTMRGLEKGKVYDEKTMKESFKAHFEKFLKENKLKTYKVEFLEVDPKKGILSCNVIINYRYPSGIKGKLSYRRAILRDKEQSKPMVTVTFKNYKAFMVERGEDVNVGSVKINNKYVKGWEYKGGYVRFPYKAYQDITFTPVF